VAGDAASEPPAISTDHPEVSPGELDRVLGQTIQERAYTWRMPRETVVAADSGNIFTRFLERLGTLVRDWASSFFHWLGKIWRHLFSRSHSESKSGSGYAWIVTLQILLYGLVAVAVVGLVVLIWRVWQGPRQAAGVVESIPLPSVPDINDENVRADQLPEDGWTKLARELLERGEFRLAMRAYYLASLAHLAARNLVSIARSKSNRDYERELRRRAHALPGLLAIFGDNLTIFERIWYGMHAVNRDVVAQFATNLERLKAG
jgi:hypothetical protein